MTDTADIGSLNGSTPLTPIPSSMAPPQEVFLVAPGFSLPQSNEAKVSALQAQLEFYFSAQNLAQDKFLKDKMNADRYVPVDLVASFPKVKKLTSSRELLIAVMRVCKNLSLDETEQMVRPARKMERNTLILRDIPSSTPGEQVQALFPGKTPVSVRADIGDTWFVVFENEEICMDAAAGLEEQRFNGNPIHFRVKSESVLRGDGPSTPSVEPLAATNGSHSPPAVGDAAAVARSPAVLSVDAAAAAQAAAAAAAAYYPMSYPMPFPGGGFVQPAFAQYMPPQFMHQNLGVYPGYVKRESRRGGGPPSQQQNLAPRKEGEADPDGSMSPATIHVSSSINSPSSPVLAPSAPPNATSQKQKKNSSNSNNGSNNTNINNSSSSGNNNASNQPGGATSQQQQQIPRGGPRLMQNFQPQSFTFNQHANKNALQTPYPVQYPTAAAFGYQYPMFPQFPQQYGTYFPQPPPTQPPLTPTGGQPSASPVQTPASPSATASSPLQQASLPPSQQTGTPLQLPAQQQLQFQLQQLQLHQFHLQQLQQLQHQQLQMHQQQQQQQGGSTATAGGGGKQLNGINSPGVVPQGHPRMPHPASALSLLSQPPVLVQYPQVSGQPLFYMQPMMGPPMMQLDRSKYGHGNGLAGPPFDARRPNQPRPGQKPSDGTGERRSPQLQPELGPEHFPALPLKSTGAKPPKEKQDSESETSKPSSPRGPVISFWSQKPPESAIANLPSVPIPETTASSVSEPRQTVSEGTITSTTSFPTLTSAAKAPLPDVVTAVSPTFAPVTATVPSASVAAVVVTASSLTPPLAVSVSSTASPSINSSQTEDVPASSPASSSPTSPIDSEEGDGEKQSKKNGGGAGALTWAERARKA